MRPVQQPKASVGLDGASFRDFLKGLRDQLLHPWRFMTVDLTRPPPKPAEVEPFERLRAHAAGSDPGAVTARKQLRVATLRGLAHATGKPMPKLSS